MDKSSKDIAGSILIALAGFGLIGFGLGYYNDVQEYRSAVEARETSLKERGNIIIGLNKLKTQYEAKSKDIDTVASIIPATKSLPEIVSSLSDLASRNGLTLNAISTSDDITASTGSYNVVTLIIEMSGVYPAFDSYLADIEKNIRLIDILSIDAAKDSSAALVNLKLTAHAYFLK